MRRKIFLLLGFAVALLVAFSAVLTARFDTIAPPMGPPSALRATRPATIDGLAGSRAFARCVGVEEPLAGLEAPAFSSPRTPSHPTITSPSTTTRPTPSRTRRTARP